ncbi:MAG: hypothetical protein R6U67_03610 [Sodalinema sp.]|uniref:hypothetical protein n=1 Tax=Sodalinema sp. TaxID=3080550 RepID=UPI00396F30E3
MGLSLQYPNSWAMLTVTRSLNLSTDGWLAAQRLGILLILTLGKLQGCDRPARRN